MTRSAVLLEHREVRRGVARRGCVLDAVKPERVGAQDLDVATIIDAVRDTTALEVARLRRRGLPAGERDEL